ncbi:phage tail sheath family protein [Exiguobacterium sp. SH5S4]|uniref:phage tail sheath family protein n=1 Tax=Exiguobacterium sp. SH5S4 TaxID=2510961 RepID=UPI0010387FC2|nr:phage tail sheath family protein [Exiguobacterium sp. SH5S4]TCI25571.1 phage tail sheath family protein [Exiguobacterium sp. SH5S4]
MAYKHGITLLENPTSLTPPVTAESAVQIVVGTAPVHLVENPGSTVNKPFLVHNLAGAVKAVGYSENFESFTLCESIYASFYVKGVAPLVLINVLDPAIHKEAIVDKAFTLSNGQGVIDEEGVLLESLVVTNGATPLVKGTDYLVAFDDYGKPSVVKLSSTITDDASLKASFDKLDPSAVTKADIIGGYDAVAKQYKGLELIKNVYPMFNVVTGSVLAPGWSHDPEVAAILQAKVRKINGGFNAMAILDIDTAQVTSYDEVLAWKNQNGYNGEQAIALWPKVKIGDKQLHYSALMGATIAAVDADNDSVPHKSPSNESVAISGAVLADGSDVYLDKEEANHLNGNGIVTLLNWNGWKTWGNNTAAYPNTTDPKDRFISIRRIFNWWGNSFILTYFDKVDDPTNYRLIESIIDSENIRANGYVGRGQLAGAKIEFRQELNPATDILNGKITFIQKIAAYPPAEHIENILEFDPQMLTNAMFGGA